MEGALRNRTATSVTPKRAVTMTCGFASKKVSPHDARARRGALGCASNVSSSMTRVSRRPSFEDTSRGAGGASDDAE